MMEQVNFNNGAENLMMEHFNLCSIIKSLREIPALNFIYLLVSAFQILPFRSSPPAMTKTFTRSLVTSSESDIPLTPSTTRYIWVSLSVTFLVTETPTIYYITLNRYNFHIPYYNRIFQDTYNHFMIFEKVIFILDINFIPCFVVFLILYFSYFPEQMSCNGLLLIC